MVGKNVSNPYYPVQKEATFLNDQVCQGAGKSPCISNVFKKQQGEKKKISQAHQESTDQSGRAAFELCQPLALAENSRQK